MAIIGAIVAAVGSIVGAGIKADKARKDKLIMQTQYQAQVDAFRADRQTGLLSFINADNQKDANLIKYTMIAVVVILIVLIWYRLKRKQ